MSNVVIAINESVQQFSLQIFDQYLHYDASTCFFNMAPGSEHYKLIGFIAAQFKNKTLIDCGTFIGLSAMALSVEPSNKVITYDIRDCLVMPGLTPKSLPNVEFKIQSCFDDMNTILESPFIVLDIDPHDGEKERLFIEKLMELKYKGLVFCDDIFLNEPMKQFWNWVPLTKIDVTKYGHFSGTGIIIFDKDHIDVKFE